nr:hypothetical protein [Tanacetum cinerariifolium]
MENTQSRNPNITNSTSSDMESTYSVYDAKVTVRGTLHTLASIKELLGQSVNERRKTRFLSTVFGKWLDFLAYLNDNLLLIYIFQHEVKQEQNNDVCPPIRYKIGNNNFEFGRQEFCLITGFAFEKIPKKQQILVKKDPLVIPRALAWSKFVILRKGIMVLYLLNDGQPNGPITTSPEGIQPIICAAVVHDPQFEQQPKEVVESVLLFTCGELVAEYHSITTSVQLIENVGDDDPSIFLKELTAVKGLKVQFQMFSMASESEIINVLTGQVSCDKNVGGFYECESSKLYYTDPKEYSSSSMTQLLQAADYAEFDFDSPENDSLSVMVKTGEEEIYLDGLETVDDPFVQTPDKQNYEEMSMYVNEVNVVNENQPPSSEKVVEQLIRKRKRLKRKARLLQIQNTRISFDDDVGDDDPDFKVLSLKEWIRSFLRYMRPLIIIDEAHLKGNYLRTNLLAVGMDGNNQIIPLATCVSQGETGESWAWFLSKLKEQIGEPPNLCIISDRHAAIIQACKAYTTEDFDKAISELRAHRPEVVRKLEEESFEKWSRAYCPRIRYNYMTSNNVESINSLTRIVRRVPITMLVEYCRDLLQMWYCEKRHKYEEAPENELCDWAAAKVYDRMLKSANWTVRPIDHLKLFQLFNKLEVHQVDLVAFQCSCRKWQISGLPCGNKVLDFLNTLTTSAFKIFFNLNLAGNCGFTSGGTISILLPSHEKRVVKIFAYSWDEFVILHNCYLRDYGGAMPRLRSRNIRKMVVVILAESGMNICDNIIESIVTRVSELLELTRKPKIWSALSDEDSVKVYLLRVSNIVFMGRESKNYIADNLIELVDDLSAWDAYPWGEYFWRALYR